MKGIQNKKHDVTNKDNSYSGATYANNYYTTINLGGVGSTSSSSDQDGARRARTVTLGTNVALVGNETTYEIQNHSSLTAIGSTALSYNNGSTTTIYSGATQTLTLDHGDRAGYTFSGYTANSGTIDGNSLFMHAADVTVSAKWTPTFTGMTLETINNKLTATFDGSSLTTVSIPTDITVEDVVLNREFTVDKPATIMLPFSKSVSDISGAKFYTFGGVEKKGDKWEATMNDVTGSIAANTPYLVMPSETNITFNGGATLNTTGGGGQQTAQSGSYWTFKGTYAFREWITNGENADEIGRVYGFAGVERTDLNVEVGDFVRVASGARIRAMNCYLLWNDTPNAAPGMNRASSADDKLPQRITVRLVNADGETTSLTTIPSPKGEGSEYWYDMSGRKLSSKPRAKGLYIHNGRKTVIK